MNRSRRILATVSATLNLALAPATAAPQVPPAQGRPPQVDVAALLNLDAERAAQVNTILQASREKIRQIRAETDEQLAAVLSANELAKLREALPSPPAAGGRARRGMGM